MTGSTNESELQGQKLYKKKLKKLFGKNQLISSKSRKDWKLEILIEILLTRIMITYKYKW